MLLASLPPIRQLLSGGAQCYADEEPKCTYRRDDAPTVDRETTKPAPGKCGEAGAPEKDAGPTYSPSYGRDPEKLQNQSRESDLGFCDTNVASL